MVYTKEKEDGSIDVTFHVTMPMKQYEEFTAVCKRDYNNIYWAYIKDMQEKAKVLTVMEGAYENFNLKIEGLRSDLDFVTERVDEVETLNENTGVYNPNTLGGN